MPSNNSETNMQNPQSEPATDQPGKEVSGYGGWLIGLLVLFIGVILIFVFAGGDAADTDTATSTEDEATTTAESETDPRLQELQDALANNQEIQCEYTDEQSNTAISYIKDGSVRVVADTQGMTSNSLFIDDTVYVWQDGEGQGFSFNPQQFSGNFESDSVPVQPDELEETIQNDQVNCSVTDIDDGLFAVPEEVDFRSLPEDYSSGSMQGGGQVPSSQ